MVPKAAPTEVLGFQLGQAGEPGILGQGRKPGAASGLVDPLPQALSLPKQALSLPKPFGLKHPFGLLPDLPVRARCVRTLRKTPGQAVHLFCTLLPQDTLRKPSGSAASPARPAPGLDRPRPLP